MPPRGRGGEGTRVRQVGDEGGRRKEVKSQEVKKGRGGVAGPQTRDRVC